MPGRLLLDLEREPAGHSAQAKALGMGYECRVLKGGRSAFQCSCPALIGVDPGQTLGYSVRGLLSCSFMLNLGSLSWLDRGQGSRPSSYPWAAPPLLFLLPFSSEISGPQMVVSYCLGTSRGRPVWLWALCLQGPVAPVPECPSAVSPPAVPQPC